MVQESATLEDRRQDGGISPLDLAALPPRLRTIMRLVLREREMTYAGLCEATDKLAPQDKMTVEELDEALHELHGQGWLLRLGEEDAISYKVRLRRKRGSSLGGELWDALDSKIKSKEEGEKKEEPGSGEGG